MQVWTHPHLCWDDAKTPCSSAVPVSIQSGCSTACTSTSWCPQTEWPAWSRWAKFTPNCCGCDQHVCWNHVPRASLRGYAVWPFPVMGSEALHTNVCWLFSFHCSFCPGKGWGLLGRVSGITFMSPNVLKSNNANTRVFSVNGSYLGYQLLLFVHTDICYSRGVIFSLTFCCPCPIWSKKKTQNLYVETGFRLDSLHAEGSSNRLRL